MTSFAASYASAKRHLGEMFGATEDLLHLHVGLVIFFAAAVLFRRRMRSVVPIALVYLFAIGNELIDVLGSGSSPDKWEPAVDILNTVAWPTLLFILARRGGKAGDPDRTA